MSKELEVALGAIQHSMERLEHAVYGNGQDGLKQNVTKCLTHIETLQEDFRDARSKSRTEVSALHRRIDEVLDNQANRSSDNDNGGVKLARSALYVVGGVATITALTFVSGFGTNQIGGKIGNAEIGQQQPHVPVYAMPPQPQPQQPVQQPAN